MRIILVATMSLVAAACGSAEKTVVETADAKVTTTGDGRYTVTTRDGATTSIEGTATDAGMAEVAASLPVFAQPYPGSTIISNMTMDDGKGGKARVVVLETRSSLTDIAAFYDKAIADAGVVKQMSLDQPGSAMRGVGVDKAGGTLIAVSDNGDSRTITLTTGNQADGSAETATTGSRGALQ